MNISLFAAAGLAIGSVFTLPNLAFGFLPEDYGNSSGDGVHSWAPGASDAAGTGTDSSLGVSHAQSSGASSHGATLNNNSSLEPQGYGTITGPAVPSYDPGATDSMGTGTDSSLGVTHSRSGGPTTITLPPP
jgi:hypothetical protein